MSSFFYMQADKNEQNHLFVDGIEEFCNRTKQQAYLLSKPLGDNKYAYTYKEAVVLLMPKLKIIFINFGADGDDFESYVDDFTEDLGSISDKYRYRDVVGRPRIWRDLLTSTTKYNADTFNAEDFLNQFIIESPVEQRKCELLISLLTGSINDVEKVRAEIPQSLLDKVKQKILLFDGDQTRFVYQPQVKHEITIQGLSGTGKTELLLHKLKEIYLDSDDTKIMFTCHNKILADNLKQRIPDFFNFMKVEQQIKWNERLWCTHAWGSQSDIDSGAFRYICHFYDLPFYRYSPVMSFSKACDLTLAALGKMEEEKFAFDFMLIDESQDFPKSFLDLCNKVTKNTVYIAGDIFQSIFDETITASISPDYLLSKCYRTDPRTLMFAHGLGMGLFEKKKLRWLEDAEWQKCGYLVEKDEANNLYKLKREPLRRFEDVDNAAFPSVQIERMSDSFYSHAAGKVLEIIKKIQAENATVTPDDVGIIIIDKNEETYYLADQLAQLVPREINWKVNKAHESKRKIKGELFVSNRNNVKGLEFPFVICVTRQIHNSYGYRNALYMTLTRSFLQTYLVLSDVCNASILADIDVGLKSINESGFIEAKMPTEAEKNAIKTTIKHTDSSMSFYDFATSIFDELKVLPILRQDLLETIKRMVGEDFDYDNVKETAEFAYKKMMVRD
ncbi:DEAD/DEAH box helicase [Undibacterium sp. SXout11W]|uniref:DEAD/DEAH box helicase n=1 Tax=Undibacterium sp. SXout11W TaxID=3413050 RepID=UPI003BF09268